MDKLSLLVADLEEQAALADVAERLTAGEDPHSIFEACRAGMELVGKRFEEGEYFLSDLMMSGELFRVVGEVLTPHLAGQAQAAPKATIVIGTVQGDVHDIGKDIVVTMLRSANYKVEDVGVDAPAERFVAAVEATGAKIVGLSGLLTVAFDPMKETIAVLKAAGFTGKIMIGGGPVTEAIRVYVGADALGPAAHDAVRIADHWLGEGVV